MESRALWSHAHLFALTQRSQTPCVGRSKELRKNRVCLIDELKMTKMLLKSNAIWQANEQLDTEHKTLCVQLN